MLRAFAATLVIIVSACSAQSPEREDIDLIIVGGAVIHPDKDAPPKIEDIAVNNGRIVAVGDNLAAQFNAETRYDAHGRYIIPGLADMHSHFGNGVLAPEEDDTSEVLARHLYFGNTTILNLGSYQAWPQRIDKLRAAMAEERLEGPRLLATGALITMPGSHPTTTIYSQDVQAKIAETVSAQGTEQAI